MKFIFNVTFLSLGLILSMAAPDILRMNHRISQAPPKRRGEIPVINGILGGTHALKGEIKKRKLSNLQVNPDLNPNQSTSSASSVQITSTNSTCLGNSTSLTGYINLDRNRSLFFWYFEAINKPDQAPLILWLNGGPGSSSMIGLFQENGPCRIKLDSKGVDPNPETWNINANMLYVDQPVGVGYSYGVTNVTGAMGAAVDMYDALQIFLADPKFSKFIGRPFGLWTESYGGHYAPIMIDYFLQMNSKVANTPKKVVIPVESLGIGNGLTNPAIQYPAYFSYVKTNPYNQTLVTDEVFKKALLDFSSTDGCLNMIKNCESSLDGKTCSAAQLYCNKQILSVLNGDRNPYDIRELDTIDYPPELTPLLNDKKFKTAIGVPLSVNWTESSDSVYDNFVTTGDWMLDSSKQLERVIDAGVRTLIYVGDADYIVNYQGVEAMVDALNISVSQIYKKQNFTNWVVDGEQAGIYKNAGNLTYLRVFGAGHIVPAYGKGKLKPGRAARVFFEQIISRRPLANSVVDSGITLNAQVNECAINSIPISKWLNTLLFLSIISLFV